MSLLIPPLVSVFLNLIIQLAFAHGYKDTGLIQIFGLVILITIIGQILRLNRIVGARFSVSSWALLRWSYFLGQSFVCMALYANACALQIPTD